MHSNSFPQPAPRWSPATVSKAGARLRPAAFLAGQIAGLGQPPLPAGIVNARPMSVTMSGMCPEKEEMLAAMAGEEPSPVVVYLGNATDAVERSDTTPEGPGRHRARQALRSVFTNHAFDPSVLGPGSMAHSAAAEAEPEDEAAGQHPRTTRRSDGRAGLLRERGAMTALVDGLRAQGYHDPVEIARGGHGIVFRAEQERFHRPVAIKAFLVPPLDEESQQRFERELQTMGRLSGHPNIVTVFAAGYASIGLPFIVMEYLPGGSLAERIADAGPLGWVEAATIGVRIGDALDTGHRLGILHRDVKPENILVSPYGDCKLGDFGIASMGSAVRPGEELYVTPAHTAPEIFGGVVPSVASDIYALGSTVWTLISGDPPFAGVDDEPIDMVIHRTCHEQVPDLHRRGVPDGLCRVLERALAKSPEDRFPSAAGFARALQAAVAEAQAAPATGAPTGVAKRLGLLGWLRR